MSLSLVLDPPLGITSPADPALGDDARLVRRSASEPTLQSPSIAADQRWSAIAQSLREAVREASRPNWDGYGAKPADSAAFSYAIQVLLHGLPPELPLPKIAVDSDGDIALEWEGGPQSVISVRVSRDGTLYYAGMVGHETFHGTETLRGALPVTIANGISRVVSTSSQLDRLK